MDEAAADFLYIGMLRDLKGPDLFIEALYNIRLKNGTAPKAHIVGEGPDEERYRNMVRKLGLDGAITFMVPFPLGKPSSLPGTSLFHHAPKPCPISSWRPWRQNVR